MSSQLTLWHNETLLWQQAASNYISPARCPSRTLACVFEHPNACAALPGASSRPMYNISILDKMESAASGALFRGPVHSSRCPGFDPAAFGKFVGLARPRPIAFFASQAMTYVMDPNAALAAFLAKARLALPFRLACMHEANPCTRVYTHCSQQCACANWPRVVTLADQSRAWLRGIGDAGDPHPAR